MTLGIYILAAGQGRRFGGKKLDALCADRALGAWTLDAIAGAGMAPGVIVVPPDAPRFAVGAQAHGWTLEVNDLARQGLATSLACAARHADRAGHHAALILLADMPLVTSRHVRAIAAADADDRPVATLYPGGRRGVPARFPRSLFGALATGQADRGAGALLAERPALIVESDFTDLRDVDSPDDLSEVEAVLRKRTV